VFVEHGRTTQQSQGVWKANSALTEVCTEVWAEDPPLKAEDPPQDCERRSGDAVIARP
jgi:hypothetical protein